MAFSEEISPSFGVSQGPESLSPAEVLNCLLTIQQSYQGGRLTQAGWVLNHLPCSKNLQVKTLPD